MEKLAIVADWLPTYGGAEHVLSSIVSLWPSAPLYTTVCHPSRLGPLASADLRPDPFLQKAYRILGRHQWLLPLLPRAIERIDLSGYDIVLSSSHAVGKGIIPPSSAVHVCYCHTPMRYAWEMEQQYLKDFRIRWPLKKFVRSTLSTLRRWDLSTAKRVDCFIANSTETQRRIRRIYGRESIVIPPPVHARFFDFPLTREGAYCLALGRLVPYKRFDLLIEVANRLRLPLKIGGTGSEEKRLKKIAGSTVEFLGFVPDDQLPSLYANARALFFPQIEDAGIVPIEAQASGVPVIGLAAGGLLDIVRDGVTGVFASEQTIDSFIDAYTRFSQMHFDREAIRQHARKFDEHAFGLNLKKTVEQAVHRYRETSR